MGSRRRPDRPSRTLADSRRGAERNRLSLRLGRHCPPRDAARRPRWRMRLRRREGPGRSRAQRLPHRPRHAHQRGAPTRRSREMEPRPMAGPIPHAELARRHAQALHTDRRCRNRPPIDLRLPPREHHPPTESQAEVGPRNRDLPRRCRGQRLRRSPPPQRVRVAECVMEARGNRAVQPRPGRDSMSRMKPSRWLLLLLLALDPRPAGAREMTVGLRSRVEVFKGSGEWRAVSLRQSLPAEKTAVLICDMWDKHWCSGATERVNALAAKMAPFLESARKRGIQIIHAPSETMAFYQDAPQRKRILALARIDPPDQFYKAWAREHPGLRIDASDVISDSGAEIYSFLRERDIRTLLVVGVHTNMCVLNRPFAIKKMTAPAIH